MHISEATAQYLRHLQGAKAPGTARTYATGVRHFTAYLESCGISGNSPITALTRPLIAGFVPWLYEHLLEIGGGHPEKVSESTKRTYFSAVTGLVEYLVVETGHLPLPLNDYDLLRKALQKAARPQHREVLPLEKLPSKTIVSALLETVYQPPELTGDLPRGTRRRRQLSWLRDIAMIETLLSSGMRVGELVRLERGHLLHEIQGATIKYGKGKRTREVLFSGRAWESMQEYLQERADSAHAHQVAHLPVFARHDRRAGDRVLPLSTRRIQQIFLDLARQAGIMERFHLTPHTLRHFFATEFLRQTGDLALTQYALGHRSPTTTRVYAQTKREDYRTAHRNVFRDSPSLKKPKTG